MFRLFLRPGLRVCSYFHASSNRAYRYLCIFLACGLGICPKDSLRYGSPPLMYPSNSKHISETLAAVLLSMNSVTSLRVNFCASSRGRPSLRIYLHPLQHPLPSTREQSSSTLFCWLSL